MGKADLPGMIALKAEGYTYAEIGSVLGISRQRVQQIVAPSKAMRRRIIAKYWGRCAECNCRVGGSGDLHHDVNDETVWNHEENLWLLCRSCHKHCHPGGDNKRPFTVKCVHCGSEYRTSNASRECLYVGGSPIHVQQMYNVSIGFGH